MTQNYEEKLGTQNMLPLILKMALPAVAAQLVNMLYNIVDRIYIGHIPNIGTDALAGISITSSIIILISAFSQIVGSGGAPLAAIALGGNHRDRAEKILGNGVTLLFLFTLVTSIISYLYMEPLLRLIGASSTTLGYAMDYLSIYLTGTLFVQISTGLNTYINCQGRPGIAMCSVLLGAFCNIILDPIFIYGLHMGVKGAALATVISQVLSAIWILRFLCSKKASLQIKKENLRLNADIVKSIFSLGIAPFVMASTESLVGFALNSTLASFGDIYVSTLSVMQSAMQIVSVPLGGFAQGFVPVISYNYGHKNKKRVKDGFKIVLIIMFSFNLISIMTMILFPGIFARIFTKDVVLIEMVTKMMPIFLAGMSIFGLQRTCQNMFIALGQAKVSLFIALLRKVILLVPLVLILPRFMGVTGVYAGEAIADGMAALLCTLIFSIQFPKILKGIA